MFATPTAVRAPRYTRRADKNIKYKRCTWRNRLVNRLRHQAFWGGVYRRTTQKWDLGTCVLRNCCLQVPSTAVPLEHTSHRLARGPLCRSGYPLEQLSWSLMFPSKRNSYQALAENYPKFIKYSRTQLSATGPRRRPHVTAQSPDKAMEW